MTEALATIRASADKLQRMVEQASAGFHEDLFVDVRSDKVEFLMQTDGRQVVSYCTFEESYFDEIDGECEAILPVGGSQSDADGFLDYMNFVHGEGTVEISFLGEEGDGDHPRLASRWRAEGALNAEIRLPDSDNDLEMVPFAHPVRWTDDNQYASKSCLEDGELPDDEDDLVVPPTLIETTAEAIEESIIDPANFVDGVNHYPLTVEDETFVVNVSAERGDDSISGTVSAETVEGPDVDRKFQKGFEEAIGSTEGLLALRTAPESGDGPPAPLTVVKDNHSDKTLRHLIGAFSE